MDEVTLIMSGEDILDLQDEEEDGVDDALVDYLLEIVTATRQSEVSILGSAHWIPAPTAPPRLGLTEDRDLHCG